MVGTDHYFKCVEGTCMVGTDHAGEAQKKHTLKIMQVLHIFFYFFEIKRNM